MTRFGSQATLLATGSTLVGLASMSLGSTPPPAIPHNTNIESSPVTSAPTGDISVKVIGIVNNRYTFPGKRPGVWQCIDITATPRFQQVSADGSRLIPRKTCSLTDEMRAVMAAV